MEDSYAKRLYDKAKKHGLTSLTPDELQSAFAIIREHAAIRRIYEALIRPQTPYRG